MGIRTAEDLYRAVRLMRQTQKEYFKTQSPLVMRLARRQEAEVDKFIEERDQRLADQKQGTLIGGSK